MEGLSQETALGFRQHPTQTRSFMVIRMNVCFRIKPLCGFWDQAPTGGSLIVGGLPKVGY